MIYQSGSNNLMYQMQANPLGAVLDKNMRNRALELMSDNTTLHQVISNMEITLIICFQLIMKWKYICLVYTCQNYLVC